MQIGGEGFGDMRMWRKFWQKMWRKFWQRKQYNPPTKTWMRWQARHDDENSDQSQPKSPETVPLTAVKITEWNSALEKIFSDMEECDPMLDQSLKFKRLTSCAFAPCAETLKAKS